MKQHEQDIEKLSRMLQHETVSEYGQQDLSKFYAFHELLQELFPYLSSRCERETLQGSILWRWKGNSDREPVLFMNHFDVVEPQDGWSHPPFCGEVFDGKLYGRGALDTKGGLWAMLQAADELAQEGFAPAQDIWFESSCCEETDGSGAEAFAKLLQERGIRFAMVLDEGGMIVNEPLPGAKGTFAMIGMGERGCADLLLTARGSGGHASAPENDTPLVRLGKFMVQAEKTALFEPRLSETTREMLRRLAPSVSGPLGFVFAHPVLFDPLLRFVMPKSSAAARALLCSTLAFTMASGSNGRNVIPCEASVVGNLRVSHHQGFEASLAAVRKLASRYGIEVTVLDPAIEAPLSDYHSPAFRRMERALSQTYPQATAVPYVMTGCSDARFMARLTDQCFRFVPFLIDAQQLESIHGIDECVDISTLRPAVEFYKLLMMEES